MPLGKYILMPPQIPIFSRTSYPPKAYKSITSFFYFNMSVWKCQTAYFVSLLQLLFITLFVLLGTIGAPFYPLQDGFSHSRNADLIGLSG